MEMVRLPARCEERAVADYIPSILPAKQRAAIELVKLYNARAFTPSEENGGADNDDSRSAAYSTLGTHKFRVQFWIFRTSPKMHGTPDWNIPDVKRSK